jgi:hypothetical protein
MNTAPLPVKAASIGAVVLALVFLAVTVLIFLTVWFALPGHHNLALGIIGILSLGFGVVSYFGQALFPSGAALQTISWGYAGLGFVLIIGAIILEGPVIGILFELVAMVFVVLMIGVAAAFALWRYNSLHSTAQREVRREGWRAGAPASAFEYTTARPNVPPPASSPTDTTGPAPPPGVSR